MYPKNAATPPEVDLGQILQLSDGAIQTSGASVRVKIGTGSWGAGAGTLSCDATSGIWTYAPTQAETNADYFIIGVYKASCSALSKTVITSASATSGYAGLDWSKITANTTTVNLSGTAVKTATDVEADTQDIQSRLPAALVSGRMDSSVGAMAANTLTASALASDAVGEIADGVYDEAYAGHTTPGTYGFLWDQWRKSNPAVTGEVTSAVTPTTTQFSTDITGYASGAFENAVLVFINGSTNADFRGIVSGYVQSNGVVTITPALPQAPVAGDEFTIAIPSFVYTLAQVQSGLATSANITEIKGVGWSSATDTLEEIRDAVDAGGGGGGGGTVIVAPLSSLAPERVNGTTISVAVGDLSPVSIDVYDANGVAIDLLAQGNLEVCIESRDNIDLQVVAHASITIGGSGNRKATWTPNAAAVGTVDKHRWSLRTATGKKVLAYGPWVVERVALSDV